MKEGNTFKNHTSQYFIYVSLLIFIGIDFHSILDVDILTVARRLFWFLMDSQGTSTVALSFVLHLISLHPECQKKIKQELERVMEERGEQEVTYSVVRDLKYTHTVIKGVSLGFFTVVSRDFRWKNYLKCSLQSYFQNVRLVEPNIKKQGARGGQDA